MSSQIDPVDLTARLIRCNSVTPAEGGAIVLLESLLEEGGFECTRVDRNGIANLFARWGAKNHPKTFGFNGHTDVVPIGDKADWSHDPFGGEIIDGWLWGRGATDMKSGVAAFAAAAIDFAKNEAPDGAIILAITGDEEGVATDGTIALLDWMESHNEQMDVCLVGEPTSQESLGDMMKIGRRGSMTAYITATGVQGHSAYPHRAKNPVSAMAHLTNSLATKELDTGNDHFDASTLALTTIDTGNPANNVIPAKCTATVNIRFNDEHSSANLTEWLKTELADARSKTGVAFDMKAQVSGESFITKPGALSAMAHDAVKAETNLQPEMSTSGGTSDARFIQAHCPVIEFGLVGKTMHQVDERVEIAQIERLKAIYTRLLKSYFT